mmetsp:Transcript_12001/g.16615  ORF Transcript_12001/g.16615 Transcript_12001/m.16615 type:complete len:225 (-) Transcript_12001:54-728(-)
MKTSLLFCLVAFCFVAIVSSEVHQKPEIVEDHYHPAVDKSHYRNVKILFPGKAIAFHEKGPFSLWYSIYARGNPVDIMFMKDKDYKDWTNDLPNPHYIDKYSHIRIHEKESRSATLLDDEPYWIVIYNNGKYGDKPARVDYDIRFQNASKGLQVWLVVLLCVGLALLLGVFLAVALLYGRMGHHSYDTEWGWGHRSQAEGYQNKTTWKVSASKLHDPEKQPLNQ